MFFTKQAIRNYRNAFCKKATKQSKEAQAILDFGKEVVAKHKKALKPGEAVVTELWELPGEGGGFSAGFITLNDKGKIETFGYGEFEGDKGDDEVQKWFNAMADSCNDDPDNPITVDDLKESQQTKEITFKDLDELIESYGSDYLKELANKPTEGYNFNVFLKQQHGSRTEQLAEVNEIAEKINATKEQRGTVGDHSVIPAGEYAWFWFKGAKKQDMEKLKKLLENAGYTTVTIKPEYD